ncbi:MAG: zf-TFIIB domain-containing protein [Candidatus Obscuribacterales bacterium]|jgi:Zn-finger nucleic acid-binding protein|nr:zf-TFIIB domain-containing protein [Candidatus Obscuribacterales bacterium]
MAEEHAGPFPCHMICPKCGAQLDQVELYAIPVERCPDCQGIFLDAGELELIMEREKNKESWLGRLFNKSGQKKE